MLLRTLGTVELRDDQESATLLGLGKPLALLIYLAAAPGRTASRSLLVALLWSDLESDAAKHALRQTIWYVRRKVGREILVATNESLTLVPEVAVDRDALLDASAAGAHADVVARYTGPFVPAFATPGGSGFEDWCALERRRLLQVFRHAAESVIADDLSRGRSRAAVELARRLRNEDPYDEGGWRLLLEACTSAGDTLAARSEAESLAQLAEREDLQLEPPTLALLRAARVTSSSAAGEAPSGQGRIQAGALVGREGAFSQLLTAWDQVRAGGMRRLHITARAGLGKTRLLRDVGARLRAMRARVAAVSGTYGATDVPFALAGELAAALARLPGRQAVSPATASTLVALNPSLSTWFDSPPRASAHDDVLRARTLALRELALAVSFEHPVAILIDDLHWVDVPSQALLGALADGLREAHVLLVTTGRAEARQAAVASHAETQHLTLDPLTAPQVEELVLSIAALPGDAWATDFVGELWRASRGSPLLALGTLQLLEERGVLRRADGTWMADDPARLLTELRAGDALSGRLEDLERGDRWLLTLLAAAGAPLDEAVLVEASERPAAEVRDRLRWLEARALVARDDETWHVAHDEIAEEIRRVATIDGLARAAARLGAAMLDGRPWDEREGRRAAQLLRTAGDDASRGEVFRRFARHRFAMGDRRPLEALAADLFGPSMRASDVRGVVRSAPLSWRLGLVSPLRLAVAAVGAVALVAVGLLAMVRRPEPPPPDAVLGLAIVDSAGRVTFRQAELREEGWSPLEPLETRPWDVIPPFDVEASSGFEVVKRPGRDEIITSQSTNDSGVIDLFLYGRKGFIRRVASSPGDDGVPRFSSRGERLVFNTARWDSLSHYDLALYDFASDSVTQLTDGWPTDDSPAWSPSGTRIVFSREHWGRHPTELCVREMASGATDCRSFDGVTTMTARGWMDEDRIVVVMVEGTRHGLYALQWSTGDRVLLKDGPSSWFGVSPDARWGSCECEATPDGGTRLMVFPIRASTLARPLQLDGIPATSIVRTFWISSQASKESQADRVRITGPSSVPAGVPTLLRASLTDARGRALTYRGALRWALDDTGAGQIDSLSGLLVLNGRRPHVTVRARSGSLARDSLTISLDAYVHTPRFEERWSDTTFARWFPFGKPSPSIVASARGPAMRNNGEGSFESGVLSRDTFDATHGLAVEVEVSGAITRIQWQALRIDLLGFADSLSYRRARGKNVSPNGVSSSVLCQFGYGLEGRWSGFQPVMTALASDQLAIRPPNDTVLKGGWATLLVQSLPDGRCAVAVDGVPLAILNASGTLSRNARIRIGGNSDRTDMLAGRVRIYEGVLAGIDWTKVAQAQR